jgi:hypothetical protein
MPPKVRLPEQVRAAVRSDCPGIPGRHISIVLAAVEKQLNRALKAEQRQRDEIELEMRRSERDAARV